MSYVFDTSPLSALFKNFYRRRFPSLWARFDDLVANGHIVSGVALILDIGSQAARTDLRSGRSVSSIAGPHRSLRARDRSCTMC